MDMVLWEQEAKGRKASSFCWCMSVAMSVGWWEHGLGE